MPRTAPPPLVMPDGRTAPSVLTWREAGELLRLEGDEITVKRALARLRDKGELKGKRIGKDVKYTDEAINRFLTLTREA